MQRAQIGIIGGSGLYDTNGSLTRCVAGRRDFDINIDKLNVDRYMPPKQKGVEGKPAPAGTAQSKPADSPKSAQPEQPIDLSPLKPLKLDGSVKVGELVANNIKSSSVRVDVRAKDGKLDVNPMQANLYQGSLKGSANVNANTNQIAVKQMLTGVSIGPLLRDAIQQRSAGIHQRAQRRHVHQVEQAPTRQIKQQCVLRARVVEDELAMRLEPDDRRDDEGQRDGQHIAARDVSKQGVHGIRERGVQGAHHKESEKAHEPISLAKRPNRGPDVHARYPKIFICMSMPNEWLTRT
jgi:hypothetical protein